MLTRLSIRNVVLIEAAELEFGAGLCVLTGETGAGKSILLDSLGLALGARADSALVRHGESTASVTATFDISDMPAIANHLRDIEVEPEPLLLLRRTLQQDGKSRAFINDQPVSVQTLRNIGTQLVELHGQHDQQQLDEAATQRELLDAYGQLERERAAVSRAFQSLAQARKQAATLEEEVAAAKREEGYLRHLAGELAQLSPKPGEEAQLAQDRGEYMRGEKLQQLLGECIDRLQPAGNAGQAWLQAQRLLARSPLGADGRFQPVMELLERAGNDIELALQQLETMANSTNFSQETLERMDERWFALKDAARKYQCTVDELAELYQQANARLEKLEVSDAALITAQKQCTNALKEYAQAAENLRTKRQEAATQLQAAMAKELKPLKMQSVQFRARVAALNWEEGNETGADEIHFEVATNSVADASTHFGSLSKIASGGELSRLMLALKAAMHRVRTTPTMIFDEIDTGTGGAVADAIGRRLALLGRAAQVLVVTHLPQVAARGAQHLLIEKQQKSSTTRTKVRTLTAQEREEELARMLAGASITPEARKAAQKLLEEAA